MVNPLCWYRARRHAREIARFRANLASYGITDADCVRIAENFRAAFATLPSVEDVARGLRQRMNKGVPDAD